MPTARSIVFIQGGGAGAHDDWDARLVDSLRSGLGANYEIFYPRMPHEDDPTFARWSGAIARALAEVADGAVVVGHSVGAAILVHYLAVSPPQRRLAAIMLLAAPFVGAGGWPGEEFELSAGLGAKLPHGVPVQLFHGLDDDTAPPEHLDLYARAIPHARLHRLPGRDHQLGKDLSEVARAIATV